MFNHATIKSLVISILLFGLILSSSTKKSKHPVKIVMEAHMDAPHEQAFKIWHFLHEKQYSINSEEGQKRFKNFKKNFDIVNNHNKSGDKNFSLSLNNFADMCVHEFRKVYLAPNARMFQNLSGNVDATKGDAGLVSFWDLPEDQEDAYLEKFLNKKIIKSVKLTPESKKKEFSSVNWVEKAGLSHVENQGHCGSCWAFSIAQAVQGAYFLKTGKNVRFSEQQLIDCESQSNGCDGGMLHTALDYIKENGLTADESYPYTQQTGKSCNMSKDKIITKVTSYEGCVDDKTCMNSESLFSVLSNGPVAAVVDASEEFMLYDEGVYDKPCTEYNHAITLIGYHKAEKNGEDSYWLVKNSWGNFWGDHGYIKIKHAKDYNNCLLDQYYTRPIIN
jgi:KDEL-tailed cysteine endopeptidase